MAGAKKVHLLTLGWERLPKAWSIHGWDPDDYIVEPVPGVLVETDSGYVLLDTGFNPALIRDPALYSRFHGNNVNIAAILPPGDEDPLLVGLERLGLEPKDVTAVVISHLHNDHGGGLRHFSGGTPIYIQQRELDFGFLPHPKPERHGTFRINYDDPTLNFVALKGDETDSDSRLFPGIEVVPTFGHTPGHQSIVVEFDQKCGGGGFVFAFDAGDLRENFTNDWPIGGTVDCDPALTLIHIKRLKEIAIEKGFVLVPGHDPVVWPRLSDELDHAGNVFPSLLSTERLFDDPS